MKRQIIILALLVPGLMSILKAQDTITVRQSNTTQNVNVNTQPSPSTQPVTVTRTTTTYVAEDDPRDLFHIGIKAGANFSNVYDKYRDDFTSDYRVGFVIGGFLSIPLGTYVGLQPELLYSQKGYNGTGTFLGINYTYRRTSSFIDLPILLQIKPSPIVSLVVGPQFSFLINNSDDFDNANDVEDVIKAFDDISLRKSTLGLTGGLDLNLYPIVISGRVGFDLQNNYDDDSSNVPRYRNMWFQLTGGIMF